MKKTAILINTVLNLIIVFGTSALIVAYEYNSFSISQWLILSAALTMILPKITFVSEI